MKTLRVFLCAMLLVWGISGTVSASPINVYDDGVGNGTWQDVNKTGSADTFLCWAVGAANSLAWTGYWGWNPAGGGSYISSATDILSAFNTGWNDRTGTPMYAYEWWMTTRTATQLPGGYTFDTPGQGFYPAQGTVGSGSDSMELRT